MENCAKIIFFNKELYKLLFYVAKGWACFVNVVLMSFNSPDKYAEPLYLYR
jgi:hypothetical protein